MDHLNNLFPRGMFRNQSRFLRDHQKRAYCVGKYQLYASIVYLVAPMFVIEVILDISSNWNIKYTYFVDHEAELIIIRTIVQYRGFDLALSELDFLMSMDAIRAFLHILSSGLIMWATRKSAHKLRAKLFCYFARITNSIFLLNEIILFVLVYPEWKFVCFFVLYRFCFEHEVRGLLNTVEMLSPRPPGYYRKLSFVEHLFRIPRYLDRQLA